MPQFARLFSLVGALFISAVVLPSSLGAQQGASGDRDTTATAANVQVPTSGPGVESSLTSGPRIARAGITAPARVRQPVVAPSQDDNVGAGPNVAMMAVGGAGIVVGSLIGGDGGTMIAIGGGVIGLIGLFRYLR